MNYVSPQNEQETNVFFPRVTPPPEGAGEVSLYTTGVGEPRGVWGNLYARTQAILGFVMTVNYLIES